jgi:hypothetical protein
MAADRCDIKIVKGALFIKGEHYGRMIPFGEQADRIGMKLKDDTLSRKKVILAEKDLFCPVRKRNVLSSGVVYGAPVLVFDIFTDPSEDMKNISFSTLADRIIISSSGAMTAKQADPGTLLNTRIIFYDKSHNTIFWNSRKICGGTQAKLLLSILRIHFREKRSEFYRQDLSKNREFIIDDYSTGLTVRINRALEIAKAFRPYIIIEKKGRGVWGIRSEGAGLVEEQE